ncbi:MAG TPA: hypothetical protein VN829_11020, partial [Dongiaceae bacterium]|nr:hypothetical protein [Dongiaceae bacterium]
LASRLLEPSLAVSWEPLHIRVFVTAAPHASELSNCGVPGVRHINTAGAVHGEARRGAEVSGADRAVGKRNSILVSLTARDARDGRHDPIRPHWREFANGIVEGLPVRPSKDFLDHYDGGELRRSAITAGQESVD